LLRAVFMKSSLTCNGTVGYQKYLNASAWPSYPQKIAVGVTVDLVQEVIDVR
jgi:hypothetical protein